MAEGVAAATFFSSFSSLAPSSLTSPEFGAGDDAFFSTASSRADEIGEAGGGVRVGALAKLIEPRAVRALDAVEPARHLRQRRAEIVRLGAPAVACGRADIRLLRRLDEVAARGERRGRLASRYGDGPAALPDVQRGRAEEGEERQPGRNHERLPPARLRLFRQKRRPAIVRLDDRHDVDAAAAPVSPGPRRGIGRLRALRPGRALQRRQRLEQLISARVVLAIERGQGLVDRLGGVRPAGRLEKPPGRRVVPTPERRLSVAERGAGAGLGAGRRRRRRRRRDALPVDGVLSGLPGDGIGLRLAGERAVGRRRLLRPRLQLRQRRGETRRRTSAGSVLTSGSAGGAAGGSMTRLVVRVPPTGKSSRKSNWRPTSWRVSDAL